MPRTVPFFVGSASVTLCVFGLSACSGSSDALGDGGTSGGGMPTGGASQGGSGSATGGGGVATGGAATGGGGASTGGLSSQGGGSGDAGSASGGASGQAGGGGLGAAGGSGGDAGGATGGKSGGGGMGSGCPAGCPGGTCFQALDGSFGCVSPPADPMRGTCGSTDPMCCTSDSECTSGDGGRCVSRMFMYRGCGGAVPFGNACYYDACSTDADCPPLQGADVHVCVPPGALGATVSVCVNGGCRTDADCTTHPSGKCLYGEAQTHGTCDRRQVFYCAYPSDPCQDRNTGCTGPLLCLPNETYDGRTCASPPPAYP